jgi:hypothetical protein
MNHNKTISILKKKNQHVIAVSIIFIFYFFKSPSIYKA